MRFSGTVVGLVVSMTLASPASADERVIRIGTEAVNAPFEYKDTDGTIKGLEVEIGNAVCERARLKCVWADVQFDALIPSLLAHKIDAALSQMSITEERRKTVDFSDPVTDNMPRYVARKGSSITEDPATLQGKIIGVQSGTTHERYAVTRLKGIAEIKIYPTQDEAYLDLQSGRIDATLGDQALSWDWLQKEGKGEFDFVGKEPKDPEIFGDGTGFALRKDDQALRAAMNTGLAAIVADGTFAKLTAKYFPFSIRPE